MTGRVTSRSSDGQQFFALLEGLHAYINRKGEDLASRKKEIEEGLKAKSMWLQFKLFFKNLDAQDLIEKLGSAIELIKDSQGFYNNGAMVHFFGAAAELAYSVSALDGGYKHINHELLKLLQLIQSNKAETPGADDKSAGSVDEATPTPTISVEQTLKSLREDYESYSKFDADKVLLPSLEGILAKIKTVQSSIGKDSYIKVVEELDGLVCDFKNIGNSVHLSEQTKQIAEELSALVKLMNVIKGTERKKAKSESLPGSNLSMEGQRILILIQRARESLVEYKEIYCNAAPKNKVVIDKNAFPELEAILARLVAMEKAHVENSSEKFLSEATDLKKIVDGLPTVDICKSSCVARNEKVVELQAILKLINPAQQQDEAKQSDEVLLNKIQQTVKLIENYTHQHPKKESTAVSEENTVPEESYWDAVLRRMKERYNEYRDAVARFGESIVSVGVGSSVKRDVPESSRFRLFRSNPFSRYLSKITSWVAEKLGISDSAASLGPMPLGNDVAEKTERLTKNMKAIESSIEKQIPPAFNQVGINNSINSSRSLFRDWQPPAEGSTRKGPSSSGSANAMIRVLGKVSSPIASSGGGKSGACASANAGMLGHALLAHTPPKSQRDKRSLEETTKTGGMEVDPPPFNYTCISLIVK